LYGVLVDAAKTTEPFFRPIVLAAACSEHPSCRGSCEKLHDYATAALEEKASVIAGCQEFASIAMPEQEAVGKLAPELVRRLVPLVEDAELPDGTKERISGFSFSGQNWLCVKSALGVGPAELKDQPVCDAVLRPPPVQPIRRLHLDEEGHFGEKTRP
jgi:hypothetical protein